MYIYICIYRRTRIPCLLPQKINTYKFSVDSMGASALHAISVCSYDT